MVSQRRVEILKEYFVEYGPDSFIQMSLAHVTDIFENVKKPFKNVKSIHMEHCYFGREISFNRIFPNLQSLRLGDNSYLCLSAFQIHFTSLVELAIHYCEEIDEATFEKIFKLNPQLEKLELFYPWNDCTFKFISCIKECCPNLQYFGLGGLLPVDFKYVTESFHFDQVVKFAQKNTLKFDIPFTFRKLKHLTVRMSYDRSISNEDISNFLNENEQLTTLELEVWNFVDLSHFFRNKILLSNIEELTIGILKIDIPSDSLIHFLTQNRSLKRFSLTGRLKNFRHFYNTIISRNNEFKIRNKAIEFTINRTIDQTPVKYVLRFVSKGSYEYQFESDEERLYRKYCIANYWYFRSTVTRIEENLLLECCTIYESTHLISKKYNEYKNDLIVLLKEIHKNNESVEIDSFLSKFYY